MSWFVLLYAMPFRVADTPQSGRREILNSDQNSPDAIGDEYRA